MEDLVRDDDGDAVQPELHQAVLEIATAPAATVPEAGAELRRLRDEVKQRAAAQGLRIAAAGTHPFARWDEQRISPDQRYRDLVDQLGFVARQEVIFGQHVHVAVDDPDTAVRVANGLRLHVPVLLALSANSPFWMGEDTGMASARTPIFSQFPRVGLQPHYADWADWERRMEFMLRAGMVDDHTWFWWDVRLAPQHGTVEVRVMDVQSRSRPRRRASPPSSRRSSASSPRATPCRPSPTSCSPRTSGRPPATGSRGSWSTCRGPIACRPPTWPAACSTVPASTPPTWARGTRSTPSRTSSRAAPAPPASARSSRPTGISAKWSSELADQA